METYLLIGGMGSGKSTVRRLLGERGFAAFDLDACGHDVLRDPAVKGELVRAFGAAVVGRDGEVDRRALARAAFAAPEATVRLNDIMHPRIVARACRRLDELEAAGAPRALVEASAYEGPGGRMDALLARCDRVVAVTAPLELRVARAVAAGFDEQDARARIAAQPDDGQRRAWADAVIENDGTLADLAARVDALLDGR